MATIHRFEDIEAWQKARALVKTVYGLTSDGAFSRDYALRNQMRRAAVSIMANIAEGFERGGDKEFLQFLALAKGSSGEVRSHLIVAMDQGYVTRDQSKVIGEQAMQVSRMIAGLMKHLRESPLRGNKYKEA